jgi:hypothetical protein
MSWRFILATGFWVFVFSAQAQAVGPGTHARGHELAAATNVMGAVNGKQIVKDNPLPSNQEWEKSANPVTIAPHRAIYTMSLASVNNGSNITGVTGSMLFEWGDACDGWVIQQHMKLHFTYPEGDESEVNSTVVSWESKDGTRYNFNVRRLTDGKETEKYRGRATLDRNGGTAVYTIPKDKGEVDLPEGAMFPSAHTKLVLEKALTNERFFTRRVFDGSDEDGEADISAFIGRPAKAFKPDDLDKDSNDVFLLDARAWPVRLAFFKPETETGEPDYEMDLVLQENGIARSMTIDYGGFSVAGALSKLESLPASECLQ